VGNPEVIRFWGYLSAVSGSRSKVVEAVSNTGD